MIVNELINPKSIVVVGGSNDIGKPGGRIIKNLLDGQFKGNFYVVNPKEEIVQGVNCHKTVNELPNVDLAIIAIASKYIADTVEVLTSQKNTKAFIILSAGFSEVGEEGKKLEQLIVDKINKVNGSLIGPNCIGMLTPYYSGVFAGPVPKLVKKGADFVSGSGATACFILEAAIPLGISVSSLFSVGNSAQIGVEDVLKYWDETFVQGESSTTKLIYIEKIDKPDMLLKHCRSLINKGCRIAAVKAGTTEAGSRAVSSHTGALAGSDLAVDALFKKAGIVRCYSKIELAYMAGIFDHKELKGENIAVITHAGGPGVMLTDTLAKNNLKVPHIEGPAADELLSKLYYGSSVANPIDFLATGNAEHLGIILDYVDEKFDNIDAAVVIYGTTGMGDVSDVYDVLHEKMLKCKKPIFGVLPSHLVAKNETEYFKQLGHFALMDEVLFGEALAKSYFTPKPSKEQELPQVDKQTIREIIDNAEDGYLLPKDVQALLDAAQITRAGEYIVTSSEDAVEKAGLLGYPVVMKVVGPVHKSDIGGVSLNVATPEHVRNEFNRIMTLKDAEAVLIQPMLSGLELFVGATYENNFGHLVLCGLGGIFIEVMKDFAYGLAPLGKDEAAKMIKSLRSYKMIQGVRGKEGVNEEKFADIIVNLSALLETAPEIAELDLNPLLAKADSIVAVDARIRIKK